MFHSIAGCFYFEVMFSSGCIPFSVSQQTGFETKGNKINKQEILECGSIFI